LQKAKAICDSSAVNGKIIVVSHFRENIDVAVLNVLMLPL